MATIALLTIVALFGGASRLHELRLALVQVASLPLLVIVLTNLTKDRTGHTDSAPMVTSLALGVLSGLALLPLIQLIPLPTGVWNSLPGHDQAVTALGLIDRQPSWLPLTLTPDRTWRSFLSLLPPIAIFLATLQWSETFRVRAVMAILGFTSVSVLLGAAQFAGNGQLYLWPTTDLGQVVGFFANRNHLATLCLLSLPFAAILGGRGLRRGRSQLPLWMSALFIGAIVVALAVIRSRMGILLLGPTLCASLLAAWIASGGGRPKPQFLVLIGGVAVALAFVAFYALTPLLERFDATGSREGRFENWPIVAEAANTFLPLGSGLGSFDRVYRSVEPLDRLDSTYFNQAHNEYLESWLETGWLGAAVLVLFLVWFGRRAWLAWRAPTGTTYDIQRAASVAIGVVLLHSAVDYPLRTEIVAVLFALCCGLLETTTRNGTATDDRSRVRTRRRRTGADD